MPCSDNERSRKITSIKYLLLNSKAQRIINLQKNLSQDSMCQAGTLEHLMPNWLPYKDSISNKG